MRLEEVMEAKDYKNVLRYFCELSQIPRGSGYNEKISNWICAFAKEHGIEYEQDEAFNVILRKPATKGYEHAKTVVLQGHMDMVCVKEEAVEHDFLTEGLSLATDGEMITANGTTLGADDGIAIAYMLALLTDEELSHPRLICLITTDEETGMDGARAVTADKIQAEYLINIDSEEEGVCWCGCAGGQRLELCLPLEREQVSSYRVFVTLGGLSGGHSGADIHKYIPNAIHVMGRFLIELSERLFYRLIDMSGGEKDNSIPVNATASFFVEDREAANVAIRECTEALESLYQRSQSGMKFSVQPASTRSTAFALSEDSREKMLFLLNQLPDGVQTMSTQIPGLVETSLNLGIFSTEELEAKLHLSLRSSVAYELSSLSSKLKQLAASVGARAESGSDYPAWEYRSESSLRELFLSTYRQFYDSTAKTAAIHAGLECGLLSELLPDTDMISIGPNMHDIHTPKERLEIDSTIRVYRVLEAMLGRIKEL